MDKSAHEPVNRTGFIAAARYFMTGFRLVRQPGLRRFVLIPLLINFIVFAGLGWFLYNWTNQWIDNWSLFGVDGDNWLFAKMQAVLHFIFSALVLVFTVYALTLLANLIGAPFNGLLAERVEHYLTGKSPNDAPSWLFLLKTMPKTMWSEVRKLLYLAGWMLLLLIAGFIPLLNVIVPFLAFAFTAWMFALEYVDYPMGNHGNTFKQVRLALKQRRVVALGFGTAVALCSFIPLLNLVVMPIAVAGATALYVTEMTG